MEKIIHALRHNLAAQIIATLLFLFLFFSIASGVTTISTNVTTDGFIRATTTADTILRLSNSTGTNNLFTLFDDTVQIFNVADGGVASGTVVRLQEGSAGTPAFSFSNDTNTGLFQNGADTIALAAGGTTELSVTTATSTFSDSIVADTSTFIVNANENRVGIGTAAPTTTIGILGTMRANGTVTVTGNFSVTGATATFYPTANAANIFQVQDSAQSNVFAISTDGTVPTTTNAGSLVVDTNTLFVNANENAVGIGTVSPTTTFGVVGTSRFNGALTLAGNFSVTGATATFYPTANAANIFQVQNSAQSNVLSVSTDGTVASTTAASSLIVDTTTLVANANENRVGVGTAGPTQLFSVGSASAFTISDAGNATTTANFTLNSRNPFIQWAPTTVGDKLSIQSGTTTLASLDLGGTWVTKGPQTANGAPDVAEYIHTRALTSKELGLANSSEARRLPETGDVVAIDKQNPETAVLATKPYDRTYLGIIADGHSSFTTLADLANDPNARPLALVGRVRVKVTSENGPVRVGDFLTGSATRPGYAMKATRQGFIIGKALENMTSQGVGEVTVFISNLYAGE